ncbi:VOC family protein, partial [Sneathiella sp.]|uniref:VOC family protein n=1 Tax=Sneathiella sp. TaxID=1964365 RepID=UPI00356A8838
LHNGAQLLTLRSADHDELAWIGWEVAGAEALDRFAARFEDAGVVAERGDAALCAEREVDDLLVLAGPDGVRLELFVRSRRPDGSGVTPIELAHVVLASSDRETSVKWYCDVLGFNLTDQIFWGDGIEASFLRCNPRHHSLALSNLVGDMRGGELGHFMLETTSLDEVGRAHDAARREKVPLAFTFGRHSNDLAFSFYAYSPSGWLVEFGNGGRLIDDSAGKPGLYDSPSLWGHEHQAPPDGDSAKTRY